MSLHGVTPWVDEEDVILDSVIVVALGGNVGCPEKISRRFLAVQRTLDKHWGTSRRSRLFRTAPVGKVQNQPDFLNAAIAWKFSEESNPLAVLALLQKLELEHGRERSIQAGPRTLDLDLLLVGRQTVDSPALHLPHPRMHERAFVLQPLKDIFGPNFRWQKGRNSIQDYLEVPAVRDQACIPWSP